MSQQKLSRREFLRLGVGAGAAALLSGCVVSPAPPQGGAVSESAAVSPTDTPVPEEPTPVPTAAPRIYGAGDTEVVVWYQDWDGANRIMTAATPPFAEKHPEVTINLQAIGYGDLFAKMLPSIAAGTEGDVMMMYTDWVVGTDVSQVFLDLTEVAGGVTFWREQMWPAAFTAIATPGEKIFYLPWLAGIRGAVLTVNKDHLAEQSIDYLNFQTFEDMVEAGRALTQTNEAGKITRAGFSPRSSQYQLLWSFIWQLGGEFYDSETGKWSHSTPEGEAATQVLLDIYTEAKTADFELFTNEFEAVSQQLVSIWGDGAWTASVQNDVAAVPTDNIVTPRLADAVADVLYPQHQAGWGLSRRLADDPDKLEAALEFALSLVSPDATIQAFEFYSGVTMTKAVYEDPRIEDVKYGLMSKRVAEEMWPVARYTQDRVANHAPAATELEKAMRQEISIQEALANMDTYLQAQEDEARERIGLN
jgi:ABC-type glycerol-3-phosphate transport system substrate-binding protein